jgi:predicted Zn-dependent protease
MIRSIARGFALLGIALLTGCATNPVSGKRELSLVSSAQETQIGREGYQAVLKEYGQYGDARLQAYVNDVGQKLGKVSHLPNETWTFTLLDDPTVNAFAMPGGYIYITRGILAHLNSEAQLAGVLGHEIGHVTARHSAQRLTQQQLAGLGLGIAGLFSEGFARYSQAAQTALGLMFLKYGRDDENQADQLGVQYATAAGYDPREIPATYAMLKRVADKSGQRLPTFLSTHPDPGSREERTRSLATQASAGKTGLIVKQRDYVQGLEGVVFGRDPRQGYFEGARYYNPELRFQMTFPEGWKTQDSKSAVVAATTDQTSMMQMTVTGGGGLSPAAYVASLERAGRIVGSQGAGETIGGYPAWAGRLRVQDQSGTQGTLLAVFIRTTPEVMFEILGKTPAAGDAAEDQILSAARSFRGLTDPGRLAVDPDRVKIIRASRSGDFLSLVQAQGAQAIGIEETAILNNAFPDTPVNTGELVKIVAAGRRR